MPKRTIKVIIDKKKEQVKFDLDGFQGNSCEDLNDLENSLGHVTERTDNEDKFQHVVPDPAFINQG